MSVGLASGRVFSRYVQDAIRVDIGKMHVAMRGMSAPVSHSCAVQVSWCAPAHFQPPCQSANISLDPTLTTRASGRALHLEVSRLACRAFALDDSDADGCGLSRYKVSTSVTVSSPQYQRMQISGASAITATVPVSRTFLPAQPPSQLHHCRDRRPFLVRCRDGMRSVSSLDAFTLSHTRGA